MVQPLVFRTTLLPPAEEFIMADRLHQPFPSRMDGDHPSVCVEIYVADHCHVCAYTAEIAQYIQSNFPRVAVQIINLFDTAQEIPEAVFATPTYLLNGALWSLGNPSLQDVQARLRAALAATD